MLSTYENCGFIPVDASNLEQYYYDWDGNLYYKDDNILEKDGRYYPVDGFDLEDLRQGLDNGVKLIFIYGDVCPPFTEEEIKDI